MDVIVTRKNREDPIKNEGTRVFTTFSPTPITNGGYLIRSDPKPKAAFPPSQMMFQLKFDCDWPAGCGDIHV